MIRKYIQGDFPEINDHPFIRELYQGFVIEEVERSNSLGIAAGGEKGYKELIIRNFWNAGNSGSIFVSSVDSLDWKEQGVEAEINQVLNHKHLGNGSILLFHNDAKYTPQALDTILKGLKEKGYDIVPVSEIIHTGEYTVNHEGRQIPSES